MKDLFGPRARTSPTGAVLLAAGFGRRMRPLSEQTPKPLLMVAGQPLLDHALDRLDAAGVEAVAVNAHFRSDEIERHLLARAARRTGRPRTTLMREPELLDTGGGVLAALADGLVGNAAPFFVVNGDSFWLDGPRPALTRLAEAFNPARYDVMLLVSRIAWAVGEVGAGDFAIDADGLVRRRDENEIVPYVFAGVQIVSPRLFAGIGRGRFSMNLLWDQAMRAGRLRAVVHDGPWFHLSRPSDIVATERALRDPNFGPPNT
ncbi:nucleotidyltransferase family protein [Lichenicoccus sp.]|uniref:nucleotidyltransferase family protein n=1 Tax=Lichenicoccus sp. TaxID=2781899 RepID=UPI003D0D4686